MVVVRRFDRGRMISRSILTSGDLVDQPFWARWFWLGLLLSADNGGYVRANMAHFRGTLLCANMHVRRPQAAAIEQLIDTYVTRKMLIRCTLDGVSCYRITNFAAGQKLKNRESARKGDGEGEGKGDGDDSTTIPSVSTPPHPDEDEAVLDWLKRTAGLGERKAKKAMRHLGLTLEDCRAWDAARPTMTESKFVYGVQRHKNPEDLTARDERLKAEHQADPSSGEDSDERKDGVMRKRSKEVLLADQAADANGEPLPPDLLEQFRESVKKIS